LTRGIDAQPLLLTAVRKRLLKVPGNDLVLAYRP
jgi:hypothetical protein